MSIQTNSWSSSTLFCRWAENLTLQRLMTELDLLRGIASDEHLHAAHRIVVASAVAEQIEAWRLEDRGHRSYQAPTLINDELMLTLLLADALHSWPDPARPLRQLVRDCTGLTHDQVVVSFNRALGPLCRLDGKKRARDLPGPIDTPELAARRRLISDRLITATLADDLRAHAVGFNFACPSPRDDPSGGPLLHGGGLRWGWEATVAVTPGAAQIVVATLGPPAADGSPGRPDQSLEAAVSTLRHAVVGERTYGTVAPDLSVAWLRLTLAACASNLLYRPGGRDRARPAAVTLTPEERSLVRGDRPRCDITIRDLLGPVERHYSSALNGQVVPGLAKGRPQSRFQPGLQAGDRARIRPRLTAQDACVDSVIDPASLSDLAGGEPECAPAQGEREQADGLGGWVGADRVRPAGGQRYGCGALAVGHTSSVGRGKVRLRYRHAITVPREGIDRIVYCNIQWEGPEHSAPLILTEGVTVPAKRAAQSRVVTDDDRELVAMYAPAFLTRERINEVGPTACQLVLDFAPHTTAGLRAYLAVAYRYVDWAFTHYGAGVERTTLFDQRTINHFVKTGMGDMSRSSRSTYRTQLMRMGDILCPELRSTRLVEVIDKVPAEAPYTAEEVAQLPRWAMQQRGAYNRHAAWCLLAFCLGAGLRSAELAGLRREDVIEDLEGVSVHVRAGRNPRSVPLPTEWEDIAIVLAEAVAPGSLVFRPDRDATSPDKKSNAVSSWSRRLDHSTINVTTGRLRNTWIVRLLNSRVPARAIALLAGVDSFTAFDRYIPYVAQPSVERVLDELRCADNAKNRETHWRNRDYEQDLRAKRRRQRQAREKFRKQLG